jgi:hypothetical protein
LPGASSCISIAGGDDVLGAAGAPISGAAAMALVTNGISTRPTAVAGTRVKEKVVAKDRRIENPDVCSMVVL